MNCEIPALSAAVLAGGKSSRMGQDKALLPLIDGGQPLLGIVLERMSAIADDVFIVANEGERYEVFGRRIVPDRHPGIGALGGIHAALAHARHQHCFVVACDMPFLNANLLLSMAMELRDFDVLAPLIPGESRQRSDGMVYQTLHAIYGSGCLRPIERQIALGNCQVVSFFPEIRLRTVGLSKIQKWDAELRSFFNANTPTAFAEARAIAAQYEYPLR
jgi:molybdopterin-guanine dinucleotide biosynthesis protein A